MHEQDKTRQDKTRQDKTRQDKVNQKHIVIRGCFNIKNTGDSQFVPTLIHHLRAKHGDIFISIICTDDFTVHYFSKAYEYDKNLSFLASGKRNLIKLLGRADYMILGPGGLFAELKPFSLIKKYLLCTAFSMIGTRQIMISCGVSLPTIQQKAKYFWFRRVLNIHTAACFRHDIPELVPYLKTNSNTYFGTDLLNAEGALPDIPFNEKRKTIIVSLANVIFKNSSDSVVSNFIGKMKQVLITVANKGYEIKLCAFDESDYPLIDRVAKVADNKSVVALPFSYDHEVTAKLFADAELSICARFHAIVFSLNYRTPCIALSYDNKCEITMEQFGLSEYNTRFDTAEDTHFDEEYKFDPQRIICLFEKLEANRSQAVTAIEAHIPILRKKAALNYKVLDEIISS